MRTFFGLLQLSPGTTAINFVAYLLACTLTISFFVFFNSTQTFVLWIIHGVDRSMLGAYNGTLVFFDQLLSLFLLGTWGSLSDIIGRRVVFCLGFVFMGLSMIGFVFAQNVYPQLLLLRLLFGVGAAASSGMVTAVLADYAYVSGNRSNTGKMSGIVGLMSGLGAVLGALGLFALPSHIHQFEPDLILCLKYAYIGIGCFSIAVSMLFFFTLKAPEADQGFHRLFGSARVKEEATSEEEVVNAEASLKVSPEESASEDEEEKLIQSCPFTGKSSETLVPGGNSLPSLFVKALEERIGCTMPGVLEHANTKNRPFYSLVIEGFRLAWERPSLLLAYLGGFIARGDSIIITLFLPLWINHYYIDNGFCQPPTGPGGKPTEFKDPQKLCDEAFKKAYMFSGIAQTVALVGAPLFGFASEKFDRISVFLFASILSFVGYFPLSFVTDPVKSPLTYLFMVLVGIGEIGMIVTSLSLAASNIPRELRGSVAGCYSFFGGLGVLVLTSAGGLVADRWITGPFFIVGVISGLLAICALIVRIKSAVS